VDLLKSKIFPLLNKIKKFFLKTILFVFRIFKKKEKMPKSDYVDFDKKLVYSLSRSKIPSLRQIKHAGKVLSKKELLAVRFLSFFILLNLIFLGSIFFKNHLIVGPIVGGEYVEGLVGTIKYVNPLYSSISDVDSDVSRLVYSSLFRYNKNGELVHDLAKDYQISEDGKVYTFQIRDDVYWHYGEKLTVDDIIFTFNAIKNPSYASSLRLGFAGVRIEKKDETHINFVLSEKYAPFLELLTFGIIPQELWIQITPESANLAELNLKPIGSGPYKFKSLIKDKSGNIRAYNLTLNEGYYGQNPYIKDLTFKFFINFTEAVSALNENIVDGISYLPNENKNDLVARDSLNFHKLNLPQIKAIFFNQEKNENLAEIKVRKALALAINKETLVSGVLEGEAGIADGPILFGSFAYNQEKEKYNFNKEEAEKLLDEVGWKKINISREEVEEINIKEETSTSTEDKISIEEENKKAMGPGDWRGKNVSDKKGTEYLIVFLTTIDDEENQKVAEAIKRYWEDIGVKIVLNMVPVSQIQSTVIEPRDFESLFFGQVVGHDPDSYVFWHSSQVGEGGLNLSNYANDDVDKMLEEGRLTLNKDERIEKYKKFQEIIANDIPAIFMYSPFYTYIQSKKIKGFETINISSPSDRFADINEWYIKTGRRLAW